MTVTNHNSFSALKGLRNLSIVPGAVFLGPWAKIDHEKFLIVAGVADEMKYCGLLNVSDLNQVQLRIIASGMLTIAEIKTFFGND